MTADTARTFLVEQLSPRYGEGEARSMARIVFEDVFDRGRAFEAAHFLSILPRLVAGEPLQYVLGVADFFGLKFKVNPAVLIPRQETEELVAWILSELKTSPGFSTIQQPVLLDIGLGSGCIGITLKKKFPALQLIGLEKSPEALAVAIENAESILGESSLLLQLYQGDVLDRSIWAKFPMLDVVVSNPPYIPHYEMDLVPEHVAAHEPALALFVDDPDPLLFYRMIADFSLQKLLPGGMLFFECNEFNAREVEAILHEKGFASVELRKDLSGAARMIRATR